VPVFEIPVVLDESAWYPLPVLASPLLFNSVPVPIPVLRLASLVSLLGGT
jgi:hypothetical protein